MSGDGISRRSLLTGLGVALAGGVAGYLVGTNSSAAKPVGPTAGPNGYGSGSSRPGAALVPLARVPAGGGVVLAGAGVVVTRSADGTVQAFSAICTHQGCTVGAVTDGAIICPCHGSHFNADTGAVLAGPATRPLPPVPVAVRGGNVYRA